MIFTSVEFAIFFIVVAAVYWTLPRRARFAWLFVSSYAFYMWGSPKHVVLLIYATLVSYAGAALIARVAPGPMRRILLAGSVVATLAPLVLFKYANFFISLTQGFINALHVGIILPTFALALPIGISFFTFQAMSFVVDVYRGDIPASVGLARFAMFKAFFPQLVAGPIERPGSLIPQFDTQRRLRWPVVAWGLLIVLWGVFKKVVVADNIAPVVETVYSAPGAHMPAALALATVLFAIQIYCDFSGYSDIARGCARMLGFRLMINFDRPYAARSFRDFWRRWHISLSTWFRDYVYLPLGGRKVGIPRYIVNVGITFLISGFWHGAAWTFVVWGAIHGMFLVCETGIATLADRFRFSWVRKTVIWNVVAWFAVMFGVSAAWIFFRAASIADALLILAHFPGGLLAAVFAPLEAIEALISRRGDMLQIGVIAVAVSTLVFVEYRQRRRGAWWTAFRGWSAATHLAIYILICLAIVFLGPPTATQFIYFQF